MSEATQPDASWRPAIVKSACTPPSRIVFVGGSTYLYLASRTGPFSVMKYGSVFVALSLRATANWGLIPGLDPPLAGCAWQPTQLSILNRGPSPASVPAIVPSTD